MVVAATDAGALNYILAALSRPIKRRTAPLCQFLPLHSLAERQKDQSAWRWPRETLRYRRPLRDDNAVG